MGFYHSKTCPFEYQNEVQHLSTGLVRYLDDHCIQFWRVWTTHNFFSLIMLIMIFFIPSCLVPYPEEALGCRRSTRLHQLCRHEESRRRFRWNDVSRYPWIKRSQNLRGCSLMTSLKFKPFPSDKKQSLIYLHMRSCTYSFSPFFGWRHLCCPLIREWVNSRKAIPSINIRGYSLMTSRIFKTHCLAKWQFFLHP